MDSFGPLARWVAKSPRPRFTIRGLILAVGLAAVVFWAFSSVWREKPSPWGGLVLVVGSIDAMAILRVAGAIGRDHESGKSRSKGRVALLVLGSIGLAASTVLVCDVAFVVVHEFFRQLEPGSHRGKPLVSGAGLVAGIAMAVMIASRLREGFWLPCGAEPLDRRRRWRRLWPLAIVAVLAAWIGFVAMCERYSFGRHMVAYHTRGAREAKDPKSAAWHERMRRVYERIIWRPWLPMRPDEFPLPVGRVGPRHRSD